jgi:hypothetical protein
MYPKNPMKVLPNIYIGNLIYPTLASYKVPRHNGLHHTKYLLYTYCGVAPRGRSKERPLLINGYASSIGFIGNDCKSTQRPTSEYWKHVGGSFPRQPIQ